MSDKATGGDSKKVAPPSDVYSSDYNDVQSSPFSPEYNSVNPSDRRNNPPESSSDSALFNAAYDPVPANDGRGRPEVIVDGRRVDGKGDVNIGYAENVTVIYGGRDSVSPQVARSEYYGDSVAANYPQSWHGEGRMGSRPFMPPDNTYHAMRESFARNPMLSAFFGGFDDGGFRMPSRHFDPHSHRGFDRGPQSFFPQNDGVQLRIGGLRIGGVELGGIFNFGGNDNRNSGRYSQWEQPQFSANVRIADNRNDWGYSPVPHSDSYTQTRQRERVDAHRQRFEEQYRRNQSRIRVSMSS
jgi:hypothetical protein